MARACGRSTTARRSPPSAAGCATATAPRCGWSPSSARSTSGRTARPRSSRGATAGAARPEHHGEPGKSSIKYEADLVLTKTTTDIIVVGHAYAPGGDRPRRWTSGFRVGPVQKVLRVLRRPRRGARLDRRRPQPFVKMPLVYERAFGGVDSSPRIPSATGNGATRSGPASPCRVRTRTGVAAAERRVSRTSWCGSWSDRPRPAGFGAIACHWQPRVGVRGHVRRPMDEDAATAAARRLRRSLLPVRAVRPAGARRSCVAAKPSCSID